MIPRWVELVTLNSHKIGKTKHNVPKKNKVVFVNEFKSIEHAFCMRMFIMDIYQISKLDEYEA